MFVQKVLGCEPKSVEDYLSEISSSENEEVYGLESVSEQMKVFDRISYKNQMNELVETAKKGIDVYKKDFNKLFQLYKEENISALLSFTRNLEIP